MSQYFVTQSGKTVGPWDLDKIYSELKSGSLKLSDYIFHPELHEWQVILISPLIEDVYKNVEIRKKSERLEEESSSFKNWEQLEWYIFKNNKQQGPFSYFEVIKLLQSKSLFDYDYVWTPTLSTWSKVFEIPAFASDQIKKLSELNEPQIQSVFFRRQFPRIHFETSVFVHNSRKLWRAKTDEISAGGCSVTLAKTELELGDKVIIHFPRQPNDQLPTFNVLCSIVSKRLIGADQHKLGVKFEALNQDIQISLRLFTQGRAA